MTCPLWLVQVGEEREALTPLGTRAIPEVDSDDPKEVFAFYGLASYLSQVFEQEVILFAVMFRLRDAKGRVSADDLFDKLDRQTLGQVLNEARRSARIPDRADALVSEAAAARNRLVHGFFQVNSDLFLSAGGRLSMIQELRSFAAMFQEADASLVAIRLPVANELGLTDEWIAHELEVALSRADSE